MKKVLIIIAAAIILSFGCSCSNPVADEVVYINDRYPIDIFRVYDPSTVTQFDCVYNEGGDSNFYLKAGTTKKLSEISDYYSVLLQNASILVQEKTEDTFTMEGKFYGYSFQITAISNSDDERYSTVYDIRLDNQDVLEETDSEVIIDDGNEEKKFQLFINDFLVENVDNVVIERGLLYLPLSDVVRVVGGFYQYINENGNDAVGGYLLDKNLERRDYFFSTGHLALSQYADNREIELDYPLAYRDDEMFVPFTVLKDLLHEAEVSVDFNTKEITAVTDSYLRFDNLVYQKDNSNMTLYYLGDPQTYGDNKFSDKVNGLGGDRDDFVYTQENISSACDYYLQAGYSRVNATINTLDWDWATWNGNEKTIPEDPDTFITALHDAGLKITYNLVFWDKEYHNNGGEIEIPRFQTEESIQRYLDFIDMITTHFDGIVDYYEIWNESDIENTIQWLTADRYIEVSKRIIPIIRNNDPDAKIVVGATGYNTEKGREYVNTILTSELMPLVDGISVHTMYATSPEFESDYYYQYDYLFNELKDIAYAHGFTGEFIAEELGWGLITGDPEIGSTYLQYETENVANKYLIRGITINRGLGFSIENCLRTINGDAVMRRIGSFFAGVEPFEFDIQIETGIPLIRHYEFIDKGGNLITSIWNDDKANDEAVIGDLSTITIMGKTATKVTAVDLFNGITCDLNFVNENGNIIIDSLHINDNPVFLVIEQQ